MEYDFRNRERKKLETLISKYEKKECVNRKQEKYNDKKIRKAKSRLLKIEEIYQLENSKKNFDINQKKELLEEKKKSVKLEAQIKSHRKEIENLQNGFILNRYLPLPSNK